MEGTPAFAFLIWASGANEVDAREQQHLQQQQQQQAIADGRVHLEM